MSSSTQMTLKILYTLDNGINTSNSYLARSKKPYEVTVANIPNPGYSISNSNNNNNNDNHSTNNDNKLNHQINNTDANTSNINKHNNINTTMKIGAINLSTILDEIYNNSPEMLENCDNLNNNGFDYNLYYKDICEVDEPLVSLGLLSKIRLQLEKFNRKNMDEIPEEEEEEEEEDDDDDEDAYIVTGRVCSNFSAMLRRSCSNSHKNKNNKEKNSLINETLEIKLKFSKVISLRNTKRNLMSNKRKMLDSCTINDNDAIPNNNSSNRLKFKQYPTTMQAPTSIIPPKSNRVNKPKRQTNPMPAPKAKRTQSLPVWNNIKPGNYNTSNNGYNPLQNSIARRIYLADRMTENYQSRQEQQQYPYVINSLQSDNTIHRSKIDESVSKRFDFMLNKKKLQNNNTTSTTTKNTNDSNVKVMKKNKNVSKPSKNIKKNEYDLSSMLLPNNGNSHTNKGNKSKDRNNALLQKSTPNDEDFNSNKENIPPLCVIKTDTKKSNSAPLASRMDTKPIENIDTDSLDLNMLEFSHNDLNWLTDLTGSNNNNNSDDNGIAFSLDNININSKDINDNHDIKITPYDLPTGIAEDLDRTSPIDTLSMPLMDLEPNHNNNNRNSSQFQRTNPYRNPGPVTTCKEQLRRLPLLAPPSNKHGQRVEIPGSEATILVNYESSSPTGNRKKGSNLENDAVEEEEEYDEDKKNNRIMPSSPSMMFGYNLQQQRDASSDEMEVDLFSSFVNQQQDGEDIGMNIDIDIDNNNDTPATTVHFTSDEK